MALEQAGVQLIAQGADAYNADLKNAMGATNSFVDATEKGGGRVSGAGQVMIGALRQVGSIAVEAFAKAARATAEFIGDSISLAGDFESGMLNFQAVAGKDVDAKGLEQFRDLFLDIGKRLPVSTSDVQKAAVEMVKGGIDPAIIAAGGLERNIQFAAAAMDGDLVKAAEISSKILGGWSSASATAAEKTDFLNHATDMLSKAANASATDVEGLSRGIFNAQGIAKTAGVGFDDLTTTLALLAPRFASSSEAGNSLKNMIARLQPTTDPAASAMEGLGLYTEETGSKFYDAEGNFVGFQKASELLKESLIGLTKEQQAQALQLIFGNDAMGAAAALADGGADAYAHMAEAMATANGVTDTAALKQQGFNTSLDNAKGSLEALQITIGSALLPVLGDLLDNYIAPGVNALTAFAETFMKMAPAIMASDDPLQSFLNALKVAAPQFLDTISSIEAFKDGLLEIVDAAMPFVSFIGDNLTPILVGVGVALTVSVVPALVAATAAFVAAAAPVLALVAAGALLYKAWESDFLGIKTTVTQVWNDTLLPAFQDMQAWLAEKIPPAIKTLSDFWTNTLQPALAEVWGFLQSKVFPVLSDLADVYIAAAILEVKALANIWTTVLWPALKSVWSFISDVLIPIFKALFDVEFAIASKVVEALAGLWQKVLWPALKSVGDYISTTVIPVFRSIGDYLSSAFGPTLNSVTKWLSDITGGFGGVTGAVKTLIGYVETFAENIKNLKLPSWLTPGSPTPWEIALYGIGTALQKSVTPGLANLQRGVSEIGAQISDTFANSDLIDELTNLGEDAMRGFGEGLKAATHGVISVINSTADTVEGAFRGAFDSNSPAKRMMPLGEDVSLGFLQGIKDGWPTLIEQVGNITADLIDSMKDIGRQIQDVIADSFDATASIDRQMAKNLDAFKDVLPEYENYTQGALQEALNQAQGFLDPSEGAKFFQKRSNQILEYAKLQKDLAEAETASDRERISNQMLLINAAQSAEVKGLEARQQAQQSATYGIVDSINEVMAALTEIDLTDDQIKIVDMLAGAWSGLQMPGQTRADAYAHPPMMPSQQTAQNVTYSQQRTYSMPIYTNNTPSALQQSLAIAEAMYQ